MSEREQREGAPVGPVELSAAVFVASPVTTNPTAKGSVFVNLTYPRNLKNGRLAKGSVFVNLKNYRNFEK